MPTKAKAPPKSVYQLKITLSDSKPPIWRRVLVDSHTKLSKQHDIFQVVMGWDNSHLHQFVINKVSYGEPYDDGFGMNDIQDEKKFWLDQLITAPKSKFSYEYDFGDSWEKINGPGGGYDLNTRMFARHFGKLVGRRTQPM